MQASGALIDLLSFFLGYSQIPTCHFLLLLQSNSAIFHTAFQIARLNLGFGRFSALPLPFGPFGTPGGFCGQLCSPWSV